MNLSKLGKTFKEAGLQWFEHNAPRLGAALAFYTIFSLAPLLVIVIAIAGFVFGREAAEHQIVGQIADLVGPEGGRAIEAMIANAATPESGILATIIGVVMLFFGATGLFTELQDALDTIWEVKPAPGRGFINLIKTRILSFSMVMGVAFLLLVSLTVSAALAALGNFFSELKPEVVWVQSLHFIISLGVILLLFAMIFRFLPDVHVAWKDVWLGAAITALLFVVGKWLLGLYLGRATVASAYGAAGSLAVLLLWLYYSAQIFLYGAEFTMAYARNHGSRTTPRNDSIITTEKAKREGLTRRSNAAPTEQSKP